jgi:curved DNA-binding protein CbpA
MLGVRPGATLEEAEAAYSRLALVHHPDRGGSDEQMAKLNAAIEKARKESPDYLKRSG